MSATPQASQGQDFVEWKTSDMLHNQKSPPQTRPNTSGLDLDVSADEQIEGSEVKATYHDKTSGATPKGLNASIAASYNDTDLSPASTFGTTATGGDSMPGTPVQPRFTKSKRNPTHLVVAKRDKVRGRKITTYKCYRSPCLVLSHVRSNRR